MDHELLFLGIGIGICIRGDDAPGDHPWRNGKMTQHRGIAQGCRGARRYRSSRHSAQQCLERGPGGGGPGLPQMMAMNTGGLPQMTATYDAGAPESASAPEASCPIDVPGRGMETETNDAAVVMPDCRGCRSVEAKPSSSCTPGGDGWEITYDMGPDRGAIHVDVCYDDDQASFFTHPGAVNLGASQFTSQEKAFFNNLADQAEANASTDIDKDGSLEALVVCVSRTLATWRFPMPVSGFYDSGMVRLGTYTGCTVGTMLTPPECRGDLFDTPLGGGVSGQGGDEGIPEEPANSGEIVPTEPPVQSPTKPPVKPPTEAPIRSPTEAPIKSPTAAPVRSPTEAPVRSPTDAPVKSPTEAPVRSPTEAPVGKMGTNFGPGSEPAPDCVNVCHLYVQSGSLLITQQCLDPTTGELDAQLEHNPCDFFGDPSAPDDPLDCSCGQTFTESQLRSCLARSGQTQCPDDPASRLDEDGMTTPTTAPVPTPAPTPCEDLCVVTVNDAGNLQIADQCIPSNEIGVHRADHPCDFFPDSSINCGCNQIGSMQQFQDCTRGRGMLDCPSNPTHKLHPDGTLVQCTDVCFVHKIDEGLNVASQCIDNSEVPSPYFDNYPCSYLKTGSCDCSPGSVDDILGCAANCPDDMTTRLQEDGTLDPPLSDDDGPNLVGPGPGSGGGPGGGGGGGGNKESCTGPPMCRVTYEEKDNKGWRVDFQFEPTCPGEENQKKNPCDWPAEKLTNPPGMCYCTTPDNPRYVAPFDGEMIKRCADSDCPFAETKTVCVPSYSSTPRGVSAVQLLKPKVESEVLLDTDPCIFEVTPDCPCVGDPENPFDADQIKDCARPGCELADLVDVCDVSFHNEGTIIKAKTSKNRLRYDATLEIQEDPCDFIVDVDAGCPCVVGTPPSFDNSQVARCAPDCPALEPELRKLWVQGEATVEGGEEETKKRGWFGLW
mmetsp:Transcript_12500/g.36886  ORF Transcript_12500/g.36886 Transcript_12500/m.36886 type:complete len:943 (-) Transcript_12500:141-2969(-)